MIFLDISIEDFLKKYPVLEIHKSKCQKCKKEMIANVPFMEKHWIGLQSKDCSCGCKGISISIVNPKSEYFSMINNYFDNFNNPTKYNK